MALLSKQLFTTNQSVKTLLVRVVVLVVVVGAQFWLWQAVTARVNDFQQKRFQAQQIDDLNNRLLQIKQNQKNQQDLLNQLDLIVPTKTSLAQIIERLERVATDRSVRLKISTIKEDQSSDSSTAALPVSPVTISAQVTGTAQQLLQYLDAIEHLQELTMVPTWDIQTTSQSDGANTAGVPASSATNQPITYTMTFDVTFWLQTTDHAK